MANTIGQAYIQIIPTTDGISGNIEKALGSEAGSAGEKAGSAFSKGFGTVMKGTGVAIAAVGTAATATGKALYDATSNLAQMGDDIDKNSQKLGVSSRFYQEWDAVLQHSGTSMSAMTGTFKNLANVASDTTSSQAAALDKLGMSVSDLEGLSTEEVFTTIITKLQGMEEGTERAAIAQDLLGRGAVEMGALLNTSAEDTQAMIDTVNELGGVLSDDAVKNAATFQDTLQDMTTAFDGIRNEAISSFLPGVTTVMDGITQLATGSENAQATLQQGMDGIMSALTTAMPQMTTLIGSVGQSLLTIAPELIMGLADGLISALPTIIPQITQLVLQLGTYLVEQLPALANAALQIIVELASGISQSLPTLIPTIAEVVLSITETLLDNIDLLVDAAVALIEGLATGLIAATPRLIAKAPEIIQKLVNALINNVPKLAQAALEMCIQLGTALITYTPEIINKIPTVMNMLVEGFKKYVGKMVDVGKNITEGIWKGIQEAWADLVANVKNLASGLVNGIKEFFQIGSPSKLMAEEVGQWLPAGIGIGVDANTDSALSALDNLGTAMDSTLQSNLDGMSYSNTYYSDYATGNGAITSLLAQYLPYLADGSNVNVSLEGDAAGIFNLVRNQNNKSKRISGRSVLA